MVRDEPQDDRLEQRLGEETADLLDGRLGPAQARALEERLRRAGRLEELARLERTVAVLRRMPGEPVPAGLVERIMQAVASERRRPAPLRRLLPWFLAAGTAAAAALLLYSTLPSAGGSLPPSDASRVDVADLPLGKSDFNRLAITEPPEEPPAEERSAEESALAAPPPAAIRLEQDRSEALPSGPGQGAEPMPQREKARLAGDAPGRGGSRRARKQEEPAPSPTAPASPIGGLEPSEGGLLRTAKPQEAEKDQGQSPDDKLLRDEARGLLGGAPPAARRGRPPAPESRPYQDPVGAPPAPPAVRFPILVLNLGKGLEDLPLAELRKRGIEVQTSRQTQDLRAEARTSPPPGELHHLLRLQGERAAVLQAAGELASLAVASRTALTSRPLPSTIEGRFVLELLLVCPAGAADERP